MIEYALLFGLGFLTAAFLVFLISPAVHRRIVWYTENRMKATMPLSPQEVRAQKDMVRALYAAENARTTQDLAREREKSLSLQLRHDALAVDAGRLAAEIGELQAQIGDMQVEAADLRSHLRKDESHISQLKTSLHVTEQANSAKDGELETLKARLNKLAEQADSLKIDMAARDTELENLKFRTNALRDERDALRREADMKEQIKATNTEMPKAGKAMRDAELAKPAVGLPLEASADDAGPMELDVAAVTAAMTDDVRKRSAALAERLQKAKAANGRDGAMREEIALIAANMVALTALDEGPSSPILPLLSKTPEKAAGDRVSLADRAAAIIADPPR